MFWDRPEYKAYEPQTFKETVTKITYDITEDAAKYHYNKGHEDGRKLATVKELTYEDGIEECAQMAEAYAYMSPNFTALAEELRAILRKAQEK